MARYKQNCILSEEFKVYFADPHLPWWRGGYENFNRQVRECFPRGTDFNTVADEEVRIVQVMFHVRV